MTALPVHREVVKGATTLVIAEMKTVAPGDKGYRYAMDKPTVGAVTKNVRFIARIKLGD